MGDHGLATNAELSGPEGIITDGDGNVFFADFDNNVVRRIDHATHIITTVAGDGYISGTGMGGFSGDSGMATNAELNGPTGLAFDAAGNLYIADMNNNRIRKVTNVGVPLSVRRAESGSGGIGGAREVKIYPNPAKDEITVEGVNMSEVRVYDLVGRLCIQHTAVKNKETIDVSALRNGVYFIEITDVLSGVRRVRRVAKSSAE